MITEQDIDQLHKRVDALTNDLNRVKQAFSALTLPVYDPTNFPQDAVEGQIALGTDGSAWKFHAGVWGSIGGGIKADELTEYPSGFPNYGSWNGNPVSPTNNATFIELTLQQYAQFFTSIGIPGGSAVDEFGYFFVYDFFGGITLRTDDGKDVVGDPPDDDGGGILIMNYNTFGGGPYNVRGQAGGITLTNGGTGGLQISNFGPNSGELIIQNDGTGGISITDTSGAGIFMGSDIITLLSNVGHIHIETITGDGTDDFVRLSNLPTADPAVPGQLYNDGSGTVKISL